MGRVEALRKHAGPEHTVRVIAVEGDSLDTTREALARFPNVDLITCNHGQREFGSTEDHDRLAALSMVGNTIFDSVRPSDDVLVYVEADLVWDPHTVGSLIDIADRRDDEFDVVAPLITGDNGIFYDVWGFRGLDGKRFSPFAPYHDDLKPGRLCEVSSAGSCLVMGLPPAYHARIQNDYCLVGWCENARSMGFRIGVHTGFTVVHP
jgi:hypothetical protein